MGPFSYFSKFMSCLCLHYDLTVTVINLVICIKNSATVVNILNITICIKQNTKCFTLILTNASSLFYQYFILFFPEPLALFPHITMAETKVTCARGLTII